MNASLNPNESINLKVNESRVPVNVNIGISLGVGRSENMSLSA